MLESGNQAFAEEEARKAEEAQEALAKAAAAEGRVPHDKQGECERGNLWGAQGVSPTFCLRFFILPSIQSQQHGVC